MGSSDVLPRPLLFVILHIPLLARFRQLFFRGSPEKAKFSFLSGRSRWRRPPDACFSPRQVSSKKSLSLKELTEEPDAVSLVRVRAALGEGRTPVNSRCGQQSVRLAPLVGLTP